jgi:hypothetical protein
VIPGACNVLLELTVVIVMERPHDAVPPGEMRGVVATEELMMLIVVSDPDER